MAVSETVVGWGVLLAVSSVSAAVIVNGVMGNYEDGKGQAYGTASNRASISVAGIATAMVMPKETAADPTTDAATHGTTATRTFTITNASNISDAYVISAATVTAGSVVNITFKPAGGAAVPVTVGSTVSPPVNVGASIGVDVTVSTAGAPVGSGIDIALTAKTTSKSQNGPQSDTGKAWVWVARGPEVSGVTPAGTGSRTSPNDSASPVPVIQTVNGSGVTQAQPGAAVAYAIPFTNIGDAPALGVTVTDAVPALLRPVAASLSLQSTDHRTGKSLTVPAGSRVTLNGNTIVATIPQLDPGVEVTLAYGTTMSASAPLGSVIANPATISAQSMTDISVIPAIVFVGAMNTVYDALAGAGQPVVGAVVSLLDSPSAQRAKLAPSGTAPNAANSNPFSTASGGVFSFGLPSTTAHETDYQLDVTATGYLNRRLKIAIIAQPSGPPTTTITALDDLPLAGAGGFKLAASPITVAGVSGFFGNVPLFAPQALKLTIAIDRSVASAGDRLGYSVEFGPGNKPLADPAALSIQLPPGVAYAHDSARLGAVPVEPVATGHTLTWQIKDLAESRTLTFDAVVLPGVTEGGALATHAHLSVTVAGAPLAADAAVNVAVTGGVLSARSILTGRVFIDHAHDGHVVAGDTGVASVRIFLEDGESALTDRDGRFSFPAARPGMHVLHLDPATLPAGLRVYHGFPVNDPRSSMRLVHGIYDSGLMSDVNFALSDGPAH